MKNQKSLAYCERLIQNYHQKGGEHVIIEEGCLGLGLIICYGEGLKTSIIKEVYVSSRVSTHSVIKYNKTPKKYLKYLSNN